MSGFEILGTLELGSDGNVHICRPDVPPLPSRPERPVQVPNSVARAIRANRARAIRVVGDSMQPGILHNDTLVVSTTRWPRNGEVVIVRAKSPHRIFGEVSGYVWRYHNQRGRAYLKKDNPRYSAPCSVTPNEIVGVVTRVLPREYRDEFENYERIQCDKALYRTCKWGDPPTDLGFYRDARVAEFRAVVDIPPSELLNDRLPWGVFRAVSRNDHPHLDIVAGDILIIEPNGESCVGVTVIERSDAGETIVGVLQREGLGTSTPGEFFVDLDDRRVLLTRKRGKLPVWRTVGLLRQIARRKQQASTEHAERQEERIAAGAGD